MTSLVRACLWISHLAILGIGVMVGLQAWDSGAPANDSSLESSGPTRDSRRPAQDASSPTSLQPAAHYAAAWETLKDKRLPRGERLGIQHALLREWSVVDLAAAIRAALAEGTRDQDDLLRSCGSGILADPSAAWGLVMAKPFGWETARVRKFWLGLIGERDPQRIFTVLDLINAHERSAAVEALANKWSDDETAPGVRDGIWSGLLALGSQPWGDKALFKAGQVIGIQHRPADLDPLLAKASSPAEKKLLGAAYAVSLYDREDEEFEVEFPRIPAAMRAEVAAAGMITEDGGTGRILEFAKLAFAEGNLDAFPPAAAHGAFADSVEDFGDPAELVDWAIGLPDDPRIIGIYSQSLHGAVRLMIGKQEGLGGYDEIREQVKATLNRVSSLPPGLRRDHGIAVLAQEISWRDDFSFVDPLVESIADPEVRAATCAELRDEEE